MYMSSSTALTGYQSYDIRESLTVLFEVKILQDEGGWEDCYIEASEQLPMNQSHPFFQIFQMELLFLVDIAIAVQFGSSFCLL
jgi:hypothetical protein